MRKQNRWMRSLQVPLKLSTEGRLKPPQGSFYFTEGRLESSQRVNQLFSRREVRVLPRGSQLVIFHRAEVRVPPRVLFLFSRREVRVLPRGSYSSPQGGGQSSPRPVCYYLKKFNKYQANSSTIEKEALALVWALQQFNVYVGGAVHPVVIFSDHIR